MNVKEILRKSIEYTKQFLDELGTFVGDAISKRLDGEYTEEEFRIALTIVDIVVNKIAYRAGEYKDYIENAGYDEEELYKHVQKLMEEDDE